MDSCSSESLQKSTTASRTAVRRVNLHTCISMHLVLYVQRPQIHEQQTPQKHADEECQQIDLDLV